LVQGLTKGYPDFPNCSVRSILGKLRQHFFCRIFVGVVENSSAIHRRLVYMAAQARHVGHSFGGEEIKKCQQQHMVVRDFGHSFGKAPPALVKTHIKTTIITDY
jgi:hypothetical protein